MYIQFFSYEKRRSAFLQSKETKCSVYMKVKKKEEVIKFYLP